MANITSVVSPAGVGGGVRVLGVPEAIAKLRGVDSVVRLRLGAMMAGAAIHLQAAAKGNIHNVSGNLGEGVQVQKLASYTWDVSASSLQGSVPYKNSKEYAPFVEFGTSKMEPRFFFSRAVDQTIPLVEAELQLLAAQISRFS
jgi:HK97 gp10 family phage protein